MKNTEQQRFISSGKQDGAVLVISLIFLLLITIVAVSSMKTGVLELLMSANEQARTEAFQRAQSLADQVYTNAALYIPLTGEVGDRFCLQSVSGGDCIRSEIDIDDALNNLSASSSGIDVGLYVERSGPLESKPPRMRAGVAIDATQYCSAKYAINVDYDATKEKQGRSQLVQGVMLVFPQSSCGNKI